MNSEQKLRIAASDNPVAEAIHILDERVSFLEGAERSGAAKRCVPSATGSAGARATDESGADSLETGYGRL